MNAQQPIVDSLEISDKCAFSNSADFKSPTYVLALNKIRSLREDWIQADRDYYQALEDLEVPLGRIFLSIVLIINIGSPWARKTDRYQ